MGKLTPMLDPFDWIELPRRLVIGVLRALWWLGWDFVIQTVGWTIGWCALRVLTLGQLPRERLGDLEAANWGTALWVELVGLALLAIAIWWLTGQWP